MNIQEYVAEQAERAGESYCHFLDSTSPDRLGWRPEVEGAARTRTILEQVAECVGVNHSIAALLRGHPVVPPGEIVISGSIAACEKLRDSVDDLASAIRSLSDADLERVFEHPRAKVIGKSLILMPVRNMYYHMGQLNYIQMMYGDTDFHVPANWR